MKKKKNRQNSEVNAGSMADIAFLLLIFFLVTTTIATDKGVAVMLPPKAENQTIVKQKERNIFNILINSQDQLLAEDQVVEVDQLKELVQEFVINPAKKSNLSEAPTKAIVSIKTDRGTSYEMYIRVRDELNYAYDELRARQMGVSIEKFQEMEEFLKETVQSDVERREQELLEGRMDEVKKVIPKMISDAEPSDIGG
ncbi:biopolymer transporter ExbD [Algivirga pacifica]|uniref:Biopolymer transporter ExbD n=1 Tax=Algivirga pacifica TaxID=1162670 RepID=A0ABP9DER6_9BACT